MFNLGEIVGEDLARRMGEFIIPPHWLGEPVVRETLARMVVLEAKLEWNPVGIRYLALSPDFKPQKDEDSRAPRYVISRVEETELFDDPDGLFPDGRARTRIVEIRFDAEGPRDVPMFPTHVEERVIDKRTKKAPPVIDRDIITLPAEARGVLERHGAKFEAEHGR